MAISNTFGGKCSESSATTALRQSPMTKYPARQIATS